MPSPFRGSIGMYRWRYDILIYSSKLSIPSSWVADINNAGERKLKWKCNKEWTKVAYAYN